MDTRPTGSICFFGAYDLDATHSFYSDYLGLELWKDQGVCRIYSVAGGGYLGFCEHIAVNASDKSPIITLLFDDVDHVYRKLSTTRYSITSRPEFNEKFGIYHFFMEDPNHYTVEIQKFL